MLDQAPRREDGARARPAAPDPRPLPPTPSMLATRIGSPRLSTRSQRPEPEASVQQTAAVQTSPAYVPEKPARPSFGARIAEAVARARGRDESTADRLSGPEVHPEAPAYAEPATVAVPSAASQVPAQLPAQIVVAAAPQLSWPAYPQAEQGDERPLLDPSILLSSVIRHWKLIFATTVLGAFAGVLIALSTPHRYYAENRLFVDPRELRLTEDDLRNQALSTEAMIALTDSQVQILTSTPVLVQVTDKLGLARDPEFNGSETSGGIAAGIALIKQLIRGEEAASESDQEAINKLRDSVSVTRDPRTFVINVGTVTRDPAKSALIANTLVDTYLDQEGAAQSGLMERASESIDTRLEALQSDLNAAERAVEEFKAENDLVGINGELLDDRQIIALTNQLAAARATKVAVKVKADSLAKARIEDVLVGTFPEEFLSGTLIELRKQYSQAKAAADSLSTSLGPRHPQYIAAQSSLESTRNEIRAEFRRIVASSQSELQRAVQTEQELAGQFAVSKIRSLDNSVELVNLRELERKAAATRNIYEGFLKRSREASERGNLLTRTARVISPAEAPLDPVGPSRKIVAIGGMVGGAVIGLGIALLLGAVESVRRTGIGGSRTAPEGNRGAPVQPGPGPGNGPGRGPGGGIRAAAAPSAAAEPARQQQPSSSIDAAGDALIRAEAALTAAEEAHAQRMAQMTEHHTRALETALAERPVSQPVVAGPGLASAQAHIHPAASAFAQQPAFSQQPAFAQQPIFAPQPPVAPSMPQPMPLPVGYMMTGFGPVPIPPAPVWPYAQPQAMPMMAQPHMQTPMQPFAPPPHHYPAHHYPPQPVYAAPQPFHALQPQAPAPHQVAPTPVEAAVVASVVPQPATDAPAIDRIRDDLRRLRARIEERAPRRA